MLSACSFENTNSILFQVLFSFQGITNQTTLISFQDFVMASLSEQPQTLTFMTCCFSSFRAGTASQCYLQDVFFLLQEVSHHTSCAEKKKKLVMLLSAWSLQFFLILVTSQQHPELHLKEIPHHSLRHWFCWWVENWREVLER